MESNDLQVFHEVCVETLNKLAAFTRVILVRKHRVIP